MNIWDKEKITYDKKERAKANCILFGLTSFFLALLFLIGGLVVGNNAKTENLIRVEATIAYVSEMDEDGLSIKTFESDKVYTIAKDDAEREAIVDKIEIGETYYFYITAAQQDKSKARLYELISDDGIVFSTIENDRLISEVFVYVSIGFFVVGTALIAVFVSLKRNPKYGESSLLEYLFLACYRFDIVTKKKPAPMSNKWRFIFLAIDILIVILFAAGTIAVSIFRESWGNPAWAIALQIILFVSMIVVPPFSLLLFMPLYNKVNVPAFTKNYLEFVRNGEMKGASSPFTENGFVYVDGEEPFDEKCLPYEECKMYVAVEYAKAFCSVNVYIVTEFNNGEDFCLTPCFPEMYRSIKLYGVEVEGLDEALDHLEENILNNVGKKRVVVIKRDGVEEKHILDPKILKRHGFE